MRDRGPPSGRPAAVDGDQQGARDDREDTDHDTQDADRGVAGQR